MLFFQEASKIGWWGLNPVHLIAVAAILVHYIYNTRKTILSCKPDIDNNDHSSRKTYQGSKECSRRYSKRKKEA